MAPCRTVLVDLHSRSPCRERPYCSPKAGVVKVNVVDIPLRRRCCYTPRLYGAGPHSKGIAVLRALGRGFGRAPHADLAHRQVFAQKVEVLEDTVDDILVFDERHDAHGRFAMRADERVHFIYLNSTPKVYTMRHFGTGKV